ncbi:MAG: S1 RNA-binding domain-containing protein [Ardenticatenales bacterium]|nr:S1 RNA-binding domain-containing protein [Ardenticatenales bacterium]MCB9172218.1 S1 RNA-binding domain-containing protein [Ardenticatenales bacterium]
MKDFIGEQQDKENSLMWEYLNQEEFDYQRPERGEIRPGIVLTKGKDEITLDIGVKLDAVVQSQDLAKLDPEELANIRVGDEIPVYILTSEDVDGRIVSSINMAKSQEDWNEAERLLESGEIFDGVVEHHNKGGLIIEFGRLRGFIPASQVTALMQRTDSGSRVERLEQMVGETLHMKVIEVDQRRRRLILSERAAMREWRAENKARLMEELQEGDVRSGVVTNLMNFGVFVDLGGADGLVHVSELAWHRVRHPKDIVAVGEEVEVYVISIDRDEERIALSMKRLQPDPWSQVAQNYSVGDVVESEVTNLTDFGAFARIAPGIEGLIHISELVDEKIEHPREVVHRGQRLALRIISIDTERQRIGLSLKRAPAPAPPEPLPAPDDAMLDDAAELAEAPVAFEDAPSAPTPPPDEPTFGTIEEALQVALGGDSVDTSDSSEATAPSSSADAPLNDGPAAPDDSATPLTSDETDTSA